VLQPHLAALSPCSPHLGECSEVVAVRSVQVRDRLLQHHGRHRTKPRPVLAQLGRGGDLLEQRRVRDVRQAGLVGVLPQPQPVVVDHPGAAERSGELLPLRRRRVKAVPEPESHAYQLTWSMRQDGDARTWSTPCVSGARPLGVDDEVPASGVSPSPRPLANAVPPTVGCLGSSTASMASPRGGCGRCSPTWPSTAGGRSDCGTGRTSPARPAARLAGR
jgi:hypothetical protein